MLTAVLNPGEKCGLGNASNRFSEGSNDAERVNLRTEAVVNSRNLQRSMYELKNPSTAQRLMLAAFGAIWVALACWLLLGGGLAVAGGWFGWI